MGPASSKLSGAPEGATGGRPDPRPGVEDAWRWTSRGASQPASWCARRWPTPSRRTAEGRDRPRQPGRRTDQVDEGPSIMADPGPGHGRAAWINRTSTSPWCWRALGDERGTEGSSLRIPARHPLRVAVQLRGAERRPGPRGHASGSSSRRSLPAGISRVVIERTGEKLVVNIHGAPGHPDRQARRRGRVSARSSRASDKEIFINIKEIRKAELDARWWRRTSRCSSSAGWRSARHEEGGTSTMKPPGHPHPVRGRWAAPRWAAASGTARAACPCTLNAHRLRVRPGQDHLRRDRGEVLGFKGDVDKEMRGALAERFSDDTR